jgi:hypothetical protein
MHYNSGYYPRHLLHAGFFAWPIFILKMEVIPSSETSIHIWSARRYVSEGSTIYVENFLNIHCNST